MGSITKLISTKIGNFVIGTIEKRIGYNLESAFFSPAGIDAVPLPDDKQFIQGKDGTVNFVILGSLMISVGAKEGELILYSRDSNGAVKAKAYLNNDGEFVLNDGTDYAVAFNDLKAEFNKLNSAWNTFATAYVPGSPVFLGTPPTALTSGANIDLAKVDKVRLP